MKNIKLEDGNTTKTSQRPARQFIMVPLPLNTYIIVLCLHPLHHCLINVSIHYTIISQYLYHCLSDIFIFYNIISQYLHHCLSDVSIHYIIVSPSITLLSVNTYNTILPSITPLSVNTYNTIIHYTIVC